MTRTNLLIAEPCIPVLPSLAVKIGINEAIFLQQVHFWLGQSGKTRDGRKWIYNSAEAWKKQLPFWSEKTIRRIIDSLREKNIIITANYNAARFDKTLWYTIDYETLARIEEKTGSEANTETDGSIWSHCPDDTDKIAASYMDNVTAPIPESQSHTQKTHTKARKNAPEELFEKLPSEKPRKQAKESALHNADFTGVEEAWDARYKHECGQAYVRDYGRERKLLTPLLEAVGAEEVRRRVRMYFELPAQYWGRDVKTFAGRFNAIPAAAEKCGGGKEPPRGALDLTPAMEV